MRWYLGYDLHEPLPDHSSMTRIRDRYGIAIFRRVFERVVDWCQREGLVWGKELYADATLVEADADRDKMLPRFAVERHLVELFGAHESDPVQDASPILPPSEPPVASPVPDIGAQLPSERVASLEAQNHSRHDWYARNGEPDRSIKRAGYQRMSDFWVSLTDRDAVLVFS